MLMIVTNWCVVNTNRVKPFLKFELVMMVVKLLEGQGLAMKEVYLFGLRLCFFYIILLIFMVWLVFPPNMLGSLLTSLLVVMVVRVVMVAYLFGLCFRKVHLRGPGGGLNRRSANNDDDIG